MSALPAATRQARATAEVGEAIRRLHRAAVETAQLQGADVELIGLGVVVTVMERLPAGERRRALAYLVDRYGGPIGLALTRVAR